MRQYTDAVHKAQTSRQQWYEVLAVSKAEGGPMNTRHRRRKFLKALSAQLEHEVQICFSHYLVRGLREQKQRSSCPIFIQQTDRTP